MHNFRVYWLSTYVFRTVFPSIIRSSRLYTQHHVCHTYKVQLLQSITPIFIVKTHSRRRHVSALQSHQQALSSEQIHIAFKYTWDPKCLHRWCSYYLCYAAFTL